MNHKTNEYYIKMRLTSWWIISALWFVAVATGIAGEASDLLLDRYTSNRQSSETTTIQAAATTPTSKAVYGYSYSWTTDPYRLQWTANGGYCGEVSLITAGMRFGQYYSQYDVRAVVWATQKGPGCSGTQCQSDPTLTAPQQQQLLVGVNDISTATALNIGAKWYSTRDDYLPGGNTKISEFFTWIKDQTRKGYSVSFGVYDASFWASEPGQRSGQATYDHIVSVVSVASNYNDSDFHPEDVLTFSDHGLYSGGVAGVGGYSWRSNQRTAASTVPLWNYTFGSGIVKTRAECDAQTTYPYCIPNPQSPGSGGSWAVAYLGSLDTQLFPVSLTTNVVSEGGMDGMKDPANCPGRSAPDYTCCDGCLPEGSYNRPSGSTKKHILTLLVSGLQIGQQYNLYRFNSWQQLNPTSIPPKPTDFSKYYQAIETNSFTAADSTYTTTYTAEAGEQVVFRAGVANLPPPRKVIVIGAGIAGIAAAKALTTAGFNVTVLEARARIGGRMWTDRTSMSVPIDLGAGWIHQGDGNPITELALRYNVPFRKFDLNSNALYDVDGTKISNSGPDALYAKVLAGLQGYRNRSVLKQDTSFQASVDSVTKVFSPSLTDAETRYLQFKVNSMVEHEYGADSSELSVYNYDEGGEFGGLDYVMTGGFDGITRGLSAGLDVRLKQIVQSITTTDKGVTLGTALGTGTSTATGFSSQMFTYTAEYVVVTVPLGVLQALSIAFSPPISNAKASAYTLVGMGALEKVWLEFATPFWKTDVQSINYVSTPKGAFSETFNIQFFTGKPVLLMFNAAAYAITTSTMTDGQILTAAMKALRTIYGGKNKTIPFYTKYVITRWKVDPYALGAYSFSKVGSSQPANRESLAAPEGTRLYFAGEHTSSLYPATVHGAYLSGLRAAAQLASYDALPLPSPAPTSSPKPVVLPIFTVYAAQTIAGLTLEQAVLPAFSAAFVNATATALNEGAGAVVVSTFEADGRRRLLSGAVTVRYSVTSRKSDTDTLTKRLRDTTTVLALGVALKKLFRGITVNTPLVSTAFISRRDPTTPPSLEATNDLTYLPLLVLILIPCCCGCVFCCYWKWLCVRPPESNRNPKHRFPLPNLVKTGQKGTARDVYEYGNAEFIRRTSTLLFADAKEENAPPPSPTKRQEPSGGGELGGELGGGRGGWGGRSGSDDLSLDMPMPMIRRSSSNTLGEDPSGRRVARSTSPFDEIISLSQIPRRKSNPLLKRSSPSDLMLSSRVI